MFNKTVLELVIISQMLNPFFQCNAQTINPFQQTQQGSIEEKLKPSLDISIKKSEKNEIREVIKKNFEIQGIYIFGNYLDEIENNLREKINSDTENNLEDRIYNFATEIPENFLTGEMNFNIKINKKERKLYVYQNLQNPGDEKILLLETLIALGGKAKDYSTGKFRNFPTSQGKFYIKRINNEPWWYPPLWAEEKKPKKPGKSNPYGLWMVELCKDNKPAGYEFSPTSDAKIRMHSTNNPSSIGSYSSHGCIRIHPRIAEELFPALLHYSKHKEPKKTGRGIIYPLENPILVEIINE